MDMHGDTGKDTFFVESDVVRAHKTDLSIIGCMDFRLQEARRQFVMERYKVAHYDQIIVPGGCKGYIEGSGEQTIGGVDVSHDLHHAEHMVLFQHTDCGAYGGSASFSSQAEEIDFQSGQLSRAREFILGHFVARGQNAPFIELFVEVIDERRSGVAYLGVIY